MTNSSLQRAIDAAGGQRALAAAIGVTQQAISYWVRHIEKVPAEHVVAVERATGVSRFDLRPDIFGAKQDQAA